MTRDSEDLPAATAGAEGAPDQPEPGGSESCQWSESFII